MVRQDSQVPSPDNLDSPISANAAPRQTSPHLRAHASFLNRAKVSLPGTLTLG
jgi:hypothetical protein